MGRRARLTALLLACAASASAETSCLARVSERIGLLRPAFPALDGLNLVLEPFESKTDFFRAKPRSPWKPARDRVYAVLVGDRACAEPPPADAETAILAHELAHLERYAAMGRRSLLALGWEYLVRPEGKAVESFEKDADDRAVKAGHAAGLAAYREWLYPRLSADEAARKRRLYRTPRELLSSSR